MNNPTSAREPSQIDCRTAVSRLWDFLDRELDVVRLAEVEAHVALCARCSEHFGFARDFLAVVARSWQSIPDTARLRSHVMSTLSKQGYRSGGS